MPRKFIQFGIKLLQNTEINILEEPNDTKIWRFVVTFGLFVWADLSAFMVSITNTDNFYAFVIPIPYVAGAVIIQTGVYFIHHHRKIIGEIFRRMDQNFHTYSNEHLIPVEYPWYLKEENIAILLTLAKYSSFGILFFINLPILGELAYYGRIKTMMFPMWMPQSKTMGSLIVEMLAFLFQMIQGVCGLWLNYVVVILLIITLIEYLRQYRRLIAAVGSLENRSSENAQDGERFDDALRENLVHCIRHYEILNENFHLFEIWFSIFFSIELSISAVTFAFALYVAMNAPSLGQIFNYFSVVIFIWMNFLLRCLISEIFSNLNGGLAEAILWSTPWYKTSLKNMKLFVIFHSMARQPLRLFGLSIFPASLVTFAKLIRMTYSFFNVLSHER